MIADRYQITREEHPLYHSALAFIERRLGQRETLEWALDLPPVRRAERRAVLQALDRAPPKEPWISAWRLLEEAWDEERPVGPMDEVRRIDVAQELATGSYSGALVTKITDLVRPRLLVKPLSSIDRSVRSIPARPRVWTDLLHARLTSGRVFDPAELHLDRVQDQQFLRELLERLEDALQHGIDVGARLGWAPKVGFWRLGNLDRVYFVPPNEREGDQHEPDEFHTGIAPAAKLLFAVMSHLADCSLSVAVGVVRRWGATDTAVHRRLWGTAGRDARLVVANDLAEFLVNAPAEEFWDVHSYPELAEARAVRFVDFSDQQRHAITAKLLKGPPRRFWAREPDRPRVELARRYWIARELLRIRARGAEVGQRAERFLQDNLAQFPDLAGAQRIDAGFPTTPRAKWVQPDPDRKYDRLQGRARLEALREALATNRRSWEDNPAQQALDWIREARHTDDILADLESDAGGADFPMIWEAFGHAHQIPPSVTPEAQAAHELAVQQLAQRVLRLIILLPDDVIKDAIEGISSWLGQWQKVIAALPEKGPTWFRIWPLAVEMTNAQQGPDDTPELNVAVKGHGDQEPMDLDTLNTPAGRMVGVFLASCPNLRDAPHPFAVNDELRAMRDAVVAAPLRSGLMARHRMIESLGYFLLADGAWTQQHLIEPLRANTPLSLPLWRAAARTSLRGDVIALLGPQMAERAADKNLGRQTRQSLAFSLVIDSLYTFWSGHLPVFPREQLTQMLRNLDDEVKAFAADAIRRFVAESAKTEEPDRRTVEDLFRQAARPFLEQVWPQDRIATAPAVAKSLAHLPAVCGEEFVDAVRVIEPFLVPFEAWSLLDYGLYGNVGDEPRISRINNEVKARALLDLLNATIGTADGAVVPMDLGSALEQIVAVYPGAVSTQQYRRLAALARR